MHLIQARLLPSFKTIPVNFAISVLLIGYAFFVWYPVLGFEFLRAYEPLWLGSAKNGFNFFELYSSHSYFYYLDYKLFGWDPRGWYLTGLITHIMGSLGFILFLKSITAELSPDIQPNQFTSIFGLIFIGSFVFLDAVSWGSFNSYYGILLLLESISIVYFLRYDSEKKYIFAMLSWCAYFGALLVRETAVFAVVLIMTLVVFRNQHQWMESKLLFTKRLALALLPYFCVTLLFIVFRQSVGGVTGDMNDENVRYRVTLLANHEYLELLWKIILTFLKNVPTLFIPFEWLNEFQTFLQSKYGGSKFISAYLFSAIGCATYIPLTIACFWKGLKNEGVGKILIFAWVIITFSLLLIAIAIPATDAVLATQYDLFTRRYNYFAFLGAAIVWAVSVIKFASLWKASNKYLNPKTVLIISMATLLVFNFVMLRSTLKTVYKKEHAEYKQFQADFKKISNDFNNRTLIYYHPASSDINDYLFAMQLTKSWVYKEVGAEDGSSLNVDSQLERVFQKLSQNKVAEKDVLFLSYSRPKGLINYTDSILDLYREKINIPLKPNATTEFGNINSKQPFADIPYAVELEFVKTATSSFATETYSDFMEWYRGLSIKALATISQRQDEPFLYYAPENAIDFNINGDFNWGGDGFDNSVELIGQEKTDVYGLWVMSPSKGYLPSAYEIVDDEGRKVEFHESLKPWGLLITFNRKINTKKVRLVIKHTYQNYPLISEMNIITKSIARSINNSLDIPRIIDQIKSERSAQGFWATVEYSLIDSEKESIKKVTKFIEYRQSGGTYSIPFLESEAKSASLDKFMKVRYKSIKVSISTEVLKDIQIKKLNFVNKY